MTKRVLSRRTAVYGAVTGTAVPLLTGCGSDPAEDADSPPSSSAPAASPPPSSTPPTSDAAEPSGPALMRADAIAVGGGQVVTAEKVVVTRPERGTFRAFDATCTHEGCLVTQVEAGEISCPCHGSRYSITDGTVTHGPAEEPLAPVEITVAGGEVRRAP